MEQNDVVMDVCLLTYNLETASEVRESLERLELLNIPLELLREHKVMELARRYMMTDGVKEAARRLLAKMRRMEGMSSRQKSSGSPNNEAKSPREEMIASKRTAPVKYTGKKRHENCSQTTVEELKRKVQVPAESEEQENKEAEREEKLQKFLARKKAATGKSGKRAVLIPAETLSTRIRHQQQRTCEANGVKETGKWPVQKQASRNHRTLLY